MVHETPLDVNFFRKNKTKQNSHLHKTKTNWRRNSFTGLELASMELVTCTLG